MADTGWVSPGTIVSESVAITSGTNWNGTLSTVANGNTADGVYAGGHKVNFVISYALKMTNFGFDSIIPSGAEITGIETRYYNDTSWSVEPYPFVEIIAPDINATDYSTETNTNNFTANKDSPADPVYDTSFNEGTNEGSVRRFNLGGDGYLWVDGVVYSTVTSSDFGFAFFYSLQSQSDNANIYEFDVKIYYSSGSPMSVKDDGTWKPATVSVNDSGTWKSATAYTKEGGVWKPS